MVSRIAAVVHLVVKCIVANMICFEYNQFETDDNWYQLPFTRVHVYTCVNILDYNTFMGFCLVFSILKTKYFQVIRLPLS